MITVSFTGDAYFCEVLLRTAAIFQMSSLGNERIWDSFIVADVPSLLRQFLEQLETVGALNREDSDWSDADNNFMANLWKAHDEYFREVNGPNWIPPEPS